MANKVEAKEGRLQLLVKDTWKVACNYVPYIVGYGIRKPQNIPYQEILLKPHAGSGLEATRMIYNPGDKWHVAVAIATGGRPGWGNNPQYNNAILEFAQNNKGSMQAKEIDLGWTWGWINKDCTTYVTPQLEITNGVVRKNENFRIADNLGEHLTRYKLPLHEPNRFKNATRLIHEHLLHAQARDAILPAVLLVMYAIARRRLFTFSAEPTILFVVGPTGCGKTWLMKMAMSLMGDFSENSSLLSFSSTPNAIEETEIMLPDSAFAADDFKEKYMSESENRRHRQQIQNRNSSRARMNKDMQVAAPTAKHACPIYSSEEVMEGDASTLGRGLLVVMGQNDFRDYDEHSREIANLHELLPSHTVQWISRLTSLDRRYRKKFLERKQIKERQIRKMIELGNPDSLTAPGGNGTRILSHLTNLTMTLHEWVLWQKELQEISPKYADKLIQEWEEDICPVLIRATTFCIAETSRGSTLFERIVSALAAGDAYLNGSSIPDAPERFPKWAKPSATMVGYLLRADKSEHQFKVPTYWGIAKICLHSGAAALFKGISWTTISRDLQSHGIVTEQRPQISVRQEGKEEIHRPRVKMLTAAHAALLWETIHGGEKNQPKLEPIG